MQDELNKLTPTSETTAEFSSRIVFTLRIILFALMMGVTTLGILLAVLNPARNPPTGAPENPIGRMGLFILFPFVLMTLTAFVLIPPILFKRARHRVMTKSWKQPVGKGRQSLFASNETEYLIATYQTGAIVQAALCEGTAFFALILAWVSQTLWPVAVTLVMLGLIASRFPTPARLENWLQTQLGLLDEEKQATF